MNNGSGAINNFKDLNAWKEGHKLVLMIYEMVKFFPREEIFGLTSQMKRASVSITSNIAEGFGRRSYKEKAYFYTIALGSVDELQNQLLISRDIGCLEINKFKNIFNQSVTVHKIINGLIKKSRSHNP